MAGSGSRDVQLVISAKNEATAAIDSVADALKTLAGVQADAGASAQKTGGLLGELAAELQALANQAKGLEALGTVAGAIDKASAAVERLTTQAERSKSDSAGLAEQYEQAATGTRTLASAAEQARAALEGQRATLAGLREQQAVLNAEVRAGESAFSQARAAVVRAKAPNDELKASYRDQMNALIGLYEQQKVGVAQIDAQKVAITEAADAYKILQVQVRAAADNERTLESSSTKAAATAEKQAKALGDASTALEEIRGLAAGASTALGGVAASQEAVAAASAKTAAEITRVNGALAAQPSGQVSGGSTLGGPAAAAVANYRAQVEAVNQAREAMRAAQQAATSLGAEMARVEAPTAELTRDFVLAKAASAQAEQAYVAQARALSALRGVTQGTFAEFSKGAGDLRALDSAAQAAANAAAALANAFAAARTKFLPLLEAEAAADASTRGLTGTLRALVGVLTTIPSAAGQAEGGISRVGETSHGVFDRMRNELLYLTTAYIGFYGAISAVENVVKTYQTLQSAQQRLAVAFEGDQRAVGNEIGFVKEQADRLGFSFNTLVNEYTRVAIAAKEAGYSAESGRKIFTAFAEASRVAGLSQQQLESAFLGLRESIERGTINARNFNLEIGQNVPGAIQAMAAAVGVSVAKFTELQKSGGGVAATEQTMVRFADNLRARFAGQLPAAVQTLNAEMGRFQTHLQEAQLAVANGGFAEGLTVALRGLDEEFKNGDGETFFRNLGAAMGTLAGIIPLVVNNFGLFITAAQIFVGIKIADALLNIARNGSLFGVSLTGAAARVDGLVAALSRLGGEEGAVSVGLARLRAGAITAGEAIEGMTVASALLAVREGAAAVGTAVLGAAITGLRGLMIAATATAEAMWIAIGGFPGLLIAGLTFVVTSLLGDWISGIGQATSAMDAHAATMEKVRQAYADTNDSAQALKDKLKDISSVQVEMQSHAIQKDLDASRTKAGNAPYDSRVVLGGASNDTVRQLRLTTEAFQQGRIGAATFKAAINALAEADPGLSRTIVAQLLETADKAKVAEKALAENNAILRELRGTATDADKALLGLKTSTDAVNHAFDTSALDRYSKSLLDLQKAGGGADGKMAELRERIQKVQDDFNAGKLDLAGSLSSKDANIVAQAQGDLAKLVAARDKALAQITTSLALDEASNGSGTKYLEAARNPQGALGARDRDALIRSTYAEAGGESTQGQAAVVNVILNRIAAGIGGTNAYDVVHARGQFESTGNAKFNNLSPNSPIYDRIGKLIDAILAGKVANPIGDATHFYNPELNAQLAEKDGRRATPSFDDGNGQRLGNHVFFGGSGGGGDAASNFVNRILAATGTPGAAGGSKGFLTYGSEVPNEKAQEGDIVVYKTGKGYAVGIYAGPTVTGDLDLATNKGDHQIGAGQVAAIRRAPTPAEQEKSAAKGESDQIEFDRSIQGLIAAIKEETAARKLSPRDAFIASKLDALDKRVADSGPTPSDPTRPKLNFTPEQRAGVAAAAGGEFDAKQQEEEIKKVAAAQLELNTLMKGGSEELTRDEYIRNEALKDGVNLLDDQGKQYAALKGKVYDLEQGQKAYNTVIGLGSQVKTAESELKDAFKRGDQDDITKAQQSIADIKAKLEAALPAARAFAEALGDTKMVNSLDKVKDSLQGIKTGIIDTDEVNQDLAKGGATAFSSFAKNVAEGKNVFTSLGNAMREFFAEFLLKIAQAIIQQQLLNLLSKSPIGGFISGGVNQLAGAGQAAATIGTTMTTAGATVGTTISAAMTAAGSAVAEQIAAAMASGGAGGGGGGGGIGGLLSGLSGGGGGAAAGAGDAAGDFSDVSDVFALAHVGGLVGAGGMSRAVSPAAFIGAARLHSGGVAGLKSDEVPTILQRNEEVLTAADPRHRFNLNGANGGPAQAAQPHSTKVINLFDPGEALSQALKTDVGEKAIFNHVRSNQRGWRAALGNN